MKQNRLYLSMILNVLFTMLVVNNIFAQTDTLTFLHITDTHVMLNAKDIRPELANARKHYMHGSDSLKQFLSTVPKNTNSDFVVITGDLVDSYESEGINGEMQDCRPEVFAKLIKACKVPVYLVMGNHDITSYWWKDSARISLQNNGLKAKAAWIRSVPCFNEGTSYSRSFVVGGKTFRLIFLDDSFYEIKPGDGITIPYIDKIQMRWLEEQLSLASDDIEVLFMHIPFQEDNTRITAENNDLYSLLLKSPSIKLLVGGHNHISRICNIEGHTQFQTGAFGKQTSNWRLVKLTGGSIEVSYPGRTENEIVISLN